MKLTLAQRYVIDKMSSGEYRMWQTVILGKTRIYVKHYKLVKWIQRYDVAKDMHSAYFISIKNISNKTVNALVSLGFLKIENNLPTSPEAVFVK